MIDETIKKVLLKRICPICNSKTGERLLKVAFSAQEGNVLPSEYYVVACDTCGFCFADVDASQEIYNQYYDSLNYYGESESIKSIVRNDYAYIVNAMELIAKKNSMIIDVGCGDGELLHIMRKLGYCNTIGMDPSDYSLKILKKKGISSYKANIFDKITDDMRHSMDVVISSAVCEHIYDLNRYIEQLSQLINEEGFIVLGVPNTDYFKSIKIPQADCFNQEHINYFSVMSLDNLMGKHGFERYTDSSVRTYEHDAVVAIYKRCKRNAELHTDTISKNSIMVYLDKNKTAFDEAQEKIFELIASKKDIVIFGAGQYTLQILASNPELANQVLFLCDNNKVKHNLRIADKIVYPAEKLNDVGENTVIAVCSMRNSDAIINQLKMMEIKNEIVVL